MTDQPTSPPPDPRPWAGQAAACLHAAARGDQYAAQASATALMREHGGEVIVPVMIAWIDTALAAQGITHADYGDTARIVFGDLDTGQTATDADDVDPAVAWAGRLMNARVALDRDTFSALLAAVPDGQTERYVNTVLTSCAHSVRLGKHLRAVRERIERTGDEQ